MNLLDTASLVVTPNGYKASKLYSIVPTDGSGDMTFVRSGDTATRVNSSGLIESVLANKPRLDYTNSTCPKLLMEPQRTNLLTYSDQFDNAAWSKGTATITANSVTSPDGTSNADTYTHNGTSYNIINRSISVTNGSTYTISCFVKKSNYRYIALFTYQTRNGENCNTYDFDTNTVNNTIAPSYPLSFVNYANGWVRLSMTFTSTSTSQYFSLALVNSAGNDLFAPPDGSAFYIYGAQFEAGAAETSYIPTTTATVTRNSDKGSLTNLQSGSLLGTTSNTIFFDYDIPSESSSSFTWMMYSVGPITNSISLRMTNTQYQIRVYNGSTQTLNYSFPTYPSKFKGAYVYNISAGTLKIFFNGTLINSVTGLTFANFTNLDIFDANGGNTYRRNYLNSFALWKTALTDSECTNLTAL